MKALKLRIKGRVQGVGFRPFVYRLASALLLTGWVKNTNEGVTIHIEGTKRRLDGFIRRLHTSKPVIAEIHSIQIRTVKPAGFSGFLIRKSHNLSQNITDISPDIAVCADCLQDMEQQPHRIHYPLVNCTYCGPRFTIIRDLPYDRDRTTMDGFSMCNQCSAEYADIRDRRFHAQPVACNNCGPKYFLHQKSGRREADIDTIVTIAAKMIDEGKIISIKGVGGFHLACDASGDQAVRTLRLRKQRDEKPFAVMFSSIEAIERYARISKQEKEVITSWQRPIVLLDLKRKNAGKPGLSLPSSVNEGLSTIGAMLPYMPFHYLLFRKMRTDAIILTSGNIADEPIVTSNQEALKKIFTVADAVIIHEREIYNRVDDSVVHVAGGVSRVLRRARGFVPVPVTLDRDVDGIVGFGAELASTLCFGKGRSALLSQHIGDLKNPETANFFRETFERYRYLFRITPTLLACDLHPEYISADVAQNIGRDLNLPILHVQHHHAHVAAVMAEHRLDRPVIGVVFDGTGMGSDNTIWGSEFLLCSRTSFSRECHLEYIALPGGDKAVEEPWRTAVSLLLMAFGNAHNIPELPFIRSVGADKVAAICELIEKKINSPLSCGAGRWFDGIAALLELCLKSGYEARAPMKLQSLVNPSIKGVYSFEKGGEIILREMVREIVRDIKKGVHPSIIATRFHNTMISVIFEVVLGLREETGIREAVLSGGVFQNKYLLRSLEKRLNESGCNVYSGRNIPVNDGGIALGQVYIAAKLK